VGSVKRTRRRSEHAELPLVGRQQELRAIADSLVALRGGEGRLLEIVGPPGIGKSRMLKELRERGTGVRILETACELYGASVPYVAFRDLLRQAIDLPTDADDATTLLHLQSQIRSRAPDLEPWLPLVAAAAGVEVAPTEEVRQLDDSFRKDQLERMVGAFLARALDDLTMVLIEDAHWMDELSCDLLGRLVTEQLADRGWLICLTRRDATSGFTAPAHDGVHAVMLSPLNTEDARLLVESATEDMPLLPRENEVLAERSGGNPLFLQELVRASTAAGIEALPDSVEAVVGAQIDQLAPGDRSVLRTAAVLGAVFDEDLLLHLIVDGADPPDAAMWQRLEEFVVPQEPRTRRFRHALMRDAAYEGLPFRRRRDLHARAGEMIERAADDSADVAELLSLHYFNAHRFPDAWRHSVIAGHRARDRFSNGRAVEFYGRALDAAPRVGGVGPREVADIREALGDVLVRMGDFRRARNVYRDARRSLEADPLGTARILMKQARIPERLGRYSDALRWLQRGWTALEGMDGVDVLRQRAQLSVFYGSIRVAQGRARDARIWCARAIEEAEASGDREALAHGYYILDWALVLEGRPTGGYENSTKALAIYREMSDPAGEAVVLNNLGAFKYFDGDWDEAIVLYKEGRDARERTGDPVNAAYGTCNIGEILCDQGRLDEAEPMLRDACRVWRAAGDRAGVAFAESLLGRLASRAGRADQAMELFARARAAFAKVGSQTDTVEIDARVAECLVFRALADDAMERVSTALVDAEALEGVSVQTPLLQRIHGYALMQLGRLDDAAEAFDASLTVAEARQAPYDVALTLRAMAQLAEVRGVDASAIERRSDDLLSELGVVAVPDVPGSAVGLQPGRPSLATIGEGAREIASAE
jgi:tetratricopeptide (TPR) repeat protein